jgi:hypothetical protein
VHPWLDSCTIVPFERFLAVSRWMLPIYGALHLVPAILFKWKDMIQNPRKFLWKGALGTCRSSAFLGVFVAIYQCELTSLSPFILFNLLVSHSGVLL